MILTLQIRLQKISPRNSRLSTDRPQGRSFDLRVIGHGQRCLSAVGVVAHHRDVLSFSNNPKSEQGESFDYFRLGCIDWEFGH